MALFRRRSPQSPPTTERVAAALASVERTAPVTILHLDAEPSLPLVELAPTAQRPWFTVATAGPGLRGNHEALRQLVIALPPDWDDDCRAAWLGWLLTPTFTYGTEAVLQAGHTVGNGDPARQYSPDAPFVGLLLWEPLITPERIEAADETVELLGVFPLHPAELEAARREGADVLLDGLDEADVSELLILDRPSVV